MEEQFNIQINYPQKNRIESVNAEVNALEGFKSMLQTNFGTCNLATVVNIIVAQMIAEFAIETVIGLTLMNRVSQLLTVPEVGLSATERWTQVGIRDIIIQNVYRTGDQFQRIEDAITGQNWNDFWNLVENPPPEIDVGPLFPDDDILDYIKKANQLRKLEGGR